ncbi:hypothetical protein [Rhodopirellula sp. SWK7]|uniref:hypothetical protein n=1 Tax=Rhodopirellula sp. SWK7 TaxID=595460 RepID=UPI001F26B27F|nr:hypothetical protein [Rhodopirellula sp. SWK7]
MLRFPALSAWTRCVSMLLMALFCMPFSTTSAQSNADPSGKSGGSPFVSDPYLVFVAEDSAYLRCGPSGDDYRTDPLRHGQELEVYVETEDGWLGVRPTDDSFCWIPADAAKLIDTQNNANAKPDAIEAEIIEDKTVAWIGTNLGRARRYRWLVQLGEGEIVTILGRSERDGPDGPQTWYRIVPPSGEFRWIHRDQVVTTAEELIAGLRNDEPSESIEFLPGGPSAVQHRNAVQPRNSGQSGNNRADRVASSRSGQIGSGQIGSGLRRVSDDQPYRDDLPRETEEERLATLAEIRRLDEIERHIEARNRSRFDRANETTTDTPIDDHVAEVANHPESAPHNGTADHQIRSFSQRVTEGLSSLLSGRQKGTPTLEPSTKSSRRVPDLVPIGSGLATTPAAAVPPASPETERNGESADTNTMVAGTTAPPQTLAAPVAQPTPTAVAQAPAQDVTGNQIKTVAATAHPEFRTGESQIAIMSSPRLVARSEYPSSAPGSFVAPRKLRTITAAQIEEVQRAVATSTPESLPTIMSSLMARGASAPEIRLVADAAQRFSMNELAQRARDYESLARRRDGDTVVSTSTLGTPTIAASTPMYPAPTYPAPTYSGPTYPAPSPTPSYPPAGTMNMSSMASTPSQTNDAPTNGGSFVARVGTGTAQPSGSIMPTSHTQSFASPSPETVTMGSVPTGPSTIPAASTSEQTGVLVEVYSADPNRPPYAITDRGGQTVAYVTPAPGVDLKTHLGSQVRIQGESGFLQGLDTPHVLATAAQRVLR